MKLWYLLVSSFLLVGCSTPFVSVTSGPVAEIRFSVEGIDGSGFLTRTEVRYTIVKCFWDRLGHIKLTKENNQRTVKVRANTPLYVNVSYFKNKAAAGTETSDTYLTFMPGINKKYAMNFKLEGNRFDIRVSAVDAKGDTVSVDVKKGSEAWERCPG